MQFYVNEGQRATFPWNQNEQDYSLATKGVRQIKTQQHQNTIGKCM